MAATQIEGAVSSGLAALDDWGAFVVALLSVAGPDQTKFDLSAIIPGITPLTTIEELGAKLAGAIALVQTMADVQTTALIPDSTVTDFVARVATIKTITERLVSNATALAPEHKVLLLDAQALSASNEANQQLNVAPLLAELYPAIQSLLASLYPIRSMAGVAGPSGFGLELAQIEKARTAQSQVLGEAQRLTTLLENITNRLQR